MTTTQRLAEIKTELKEGRMYRGDLDWLIARVEELEAAHCSQSHGAGGGDERRRAVSGHDETKLPKWARELLAEERRKAERIQEDLDRVRVAHALLFDREWFTIEGPREDITEDHYYLWMLHPTRPHAMCSLGRGDALLVGRRRAPQSTTTTREAARTTDAG